VKNYIVKYAAPILVVLCCMAFRIPDATKLPSVEVKAMNGKRVNTSDINNDGKPLVIVVWEVTCKPGIKELNAISREYKNWKSTTGVKVVAISVDESRNASQVQSLWVSRGWEFESYLDPNQMFKRAMNIPVCPYVFIIDGHGDIVWQKGGYGPGDEKVIYDVVLKTSKGEPIN
jgi:cytochrome c biogenesis protein CcmG/thiol:disulfide interchange protein DsbE